MSFGAHCIVTNIKKWGICKLNSENSDRKWKLGKCSPKETDWLIEIYKHQYQDFMLIWSMKASRKNK